MENKKKTSVKDIMQKLGTAMALAILCLIFSIVLPTKFPTVDNIMNILRQASINCLIAAGMLCALITAGIDLSVGSNCVLCTCTIGVMVEAGITHPLLLILAGLAVSTFAGFINGTLLTRLDLPHPFVSTMGMKNVLLGVALVITGSKSIAFTNKGIDDLMWIGGGSVGVVRDALGRVTFPGIPFSFILVIVVYIIFDIFLRKTALGRQIYCCGGNPEAARLSGIPSKNVLTFVYALSGFMAGMAGVISVGRLASANANAGLTYDNDAIAACIVGGASFTGGKGTIWGTMIGALLMAVIRNGLNLLGASNDIQYIVIGAVIILAVTLDVVRNKMEAKARKMAAK
jgi:ribose transport system permease protein